MSFIKYQNGYIRHGNRGWTAYEKKTVEQGSFISVSNKQFSRERGKHSKRSFEYFKAIEKFIDEAIN